MDRKIRNWYMETYPTDSLGAEIAEDLTFEDIYKGMQNGEDVYDLIGVYDSVIRERCFKELSATLNIDYDEIYDLWVTPKRKAV